MRELGLLTYNSEELQLNLEFIVSEENKNARAETRTPVPSLATTDSNH